MDQTIQNMFSEVPQTYERINHILTLGLDRLWRRRTAQIAGRTGGDNWLDLCCGTGEMTRRLKHIAPTGTKITAVDFSEPMLNIARTRPTCSDIEFVVSDIKKLPFPDNTFDLATMAFATRNNNPSRDTLMACFKECRRVLKPGGTFINLETSQPSGRLVRSVFHLYVKTWVGTIGGLLSGSYAAYHYLSKSMTGFYSPGELAEILKQAGFKQVCAQPMSLGAVAIHQAEA